MLVPCDFRGESGANLTCSLDSQPMLSYIHPIHSEALNVIVNGIFDILRIDIAIYLKLKSN